jgi:glucosyl-3-phosphoglycerate phosphatase
VTERRLLLVRHGVTDWNREGRFQGHLDPPLGDDGRGEARLLARRMSNDDLLRPMRIVSSTLARALETAEVIGSAVGVDVEPDRRLIEIGQGEWEGRTHADLVATDGDRYQAWLRAAPIRQPPGGEPIDAATARVRSLIDDLTTGPGPWPVCLVSHGGTLRIVARVLFEGAETTSWSLDVDNASLGICTTIEHGWRLDRWNDTFHLLGRIATHVDETEGRPLAL